MNNIGMVGLAVMGSSLALNMASHGFKVACYDYSKEFTDKFLEGKGKGNDNLTGYYDLESFIASLEKPRRVFLMIRAGAPVDSMIEKLIPLLEAGDIVMDGGNSYYEDTVRRYEFLTGKGLMYMGIGVSGGEEGALKGPSMMPGGSFEAWEYLKPILTTICAKANDGTPCCDFVGRGGAGHYVKMVHNGIEYGDIQLICEAYSFMKNYLGLSNDEMSEVFKEWNKGELDSYLIEITGNILSFKDENGVYTVDTILDKAGQKGTGMWTAIEALKEGVPLTLIAESVYARCLSAAKDERVIASAEFPREMPKFDGDKAELISALKEALYLSKLISYAQGFSLLRAANNHYDWNLNFCGISDMWRGGCIIRSVFLSKIKEAFTANPNIQNILLADYFKDVAKNYIGSLRKILSTSIMNGIPMPCFSAALSYFDGYTSSSLPANLLQAQRDYFGAHTYEVIGKEGSHHTNWY